MESCPKCGSNEYTRDGKIDDRQRYKCKSCGYRFTVNFRGFGTDIKRQALMLYLHGLCYRSIGDLLQCSHVSVYNWIKPYGDSIDEIRSAAGVEIVALEEIYARISAQENNDSGSGLLLIDLQNHTSPALCVTEPLSSESDDTDEPKP